MIWPEANTEVTLVWKWKPDRLDAVIGIIGAVATASVALASTDNITLPLLVGVVVVAVTVAAKHILQIRTSEKRRERAVSESVRPYPPKRVSEIEPHSDLGVGPERPDKYIPRPPYDGQIAAALRNHGFVLLIAPALWGKTHSVYEATRRVYADAPLIRPSSVDGLRRLLGLDPPWQPDQPKDRPWILWLDDLDQYLAGEAPVLDEAVLATLLNRPSMGLSPVVVVATMRRGRRWELVRAHDRSALTSRGVLRLAEMTGAIIEAADEGFELSEEEKQAGLALEPDADSRRGIGRKFTTLPALLDKYGAGPDTHPEGWATVKAAVDWKRCGMDWPIPTQTLEALAGSYLAGRHLRAGWFQDALDEWAADADADTGASLLAPAPDEHGFKAAEAIVAYDEGEGRPGGPRPIPQTAWKEVTHFASPEQAAKVTRAAALRLQMTEGGNVRTIIDAWETAAKKADEGGVADGTYMLGLLRYRQDERAEAEQLWRKATAADHADAANNLGYLLEHKPYASEEEERLAHLEAKKAYQFAAGQGHAKAANNLGGMLFRERDFMNAEDSFRDAIDLDNVDAMANLGVLCEFQERVEEAATWYRKAAEAGSIAGARRLGRLLSKQGNVAEAKQWYSKAAEAGDVEAAFELGLFLNRMDDARSAEFWLRNAAEQGDIGAQVHLSDLLQEQGRREEAESFGQKALDALSEIGSAIEAETQSVDQWLSNSHFEVGKVHYQHGEIEEAAKEFEAASEAGHVGGTFGLGVVREEQGRTDEAEDLYRKAAEAGHVEAAAKFGALLEGNGRLAEAERFLEQAQKGGSAEGAFRLGAMLERNGRHARAERMYRQAVDQLHAQACLALIDLLNRQQRTREAKELIPKAGEAAYIQGLIFEQQQREEAAEEWYRKAAEADHIDGAFHLGLLLGVRGDPDGDVWLHKAAAAGHRLAAWMLKGEADPKATEQEVDSPPLAEE
jgi:TPR repeat protein